MKFKTYFLIFICVFFVICKYSPIIFYTIFLLLISYIYILFIDGASAKYKFGSKISFGKGSFHGSTHGRSRGTLHGTSRGSLSGTSYRFPYGRTSNRANSNQGVHDYGVSNSKPSHSTGNSAGNLMCYII